MLSRAGTCWHIDGQVDMTQLIGTFCNYAVGPAEIGTWNFGHCLRMVMRYGMLNVTETSVNILWLALQHHTWLVVSVRPSLKNLSNNWPEFSVKLWFHGIAVGVWYKWTTKLKGFLWKSARDRNCQKLHWNFKWEFILVKYINLCPPVLVEHVMSCIKELI